MFSTAKVLPLPRVPNPSGCITHISPIPLPENPTYIASEDVTIIVPTIDAGEKFKEAANSWLVGKPKKIFIITEEKKCLALYKTLPIYQVDPERTSSSLPTTPFGHHAFAICIGLLQKPEIWGVLALVSVFKQWEGVMTVWEVLATFRLTIRNIETSSTGYPYLWRDILSIPESA